VYKVFNLKARNILACAKHFAGYAFAESGRDYNTVDVGESTLQNIVFHHLKLGGWYVLL
jgi:beta-glucosidase